jgi:hypothetical protein
MYPVERNTKRNALVQENGILSTYCNLKIEHDPLRDEFTAL